MLTFSSPYTFQEAEIALFLAFEDGTPLRNPQSKEILAPVAVCLGSFSLQQIAEDSPANIANWNAANPKAPRPKWKASLSNTSGAWKRNGVPISFTINPSQNYILLVRIHDEINHNWELIQLHFCTFDTQENQGQNPNITDTLSLAASHCEHFSGNTSIESLPALLPRILATVEWEHEGHAFPCFYYNPDTETWSEASQNSFLDSLGNPHRYAYVGPDANDATQFVVSYLTIGTAAQTQPGNTLTRSGLQFAYVTPIFIGNHLTNNHHGLDTRTHSLQLLGCPEPITDTPSSAHWRHPLLRFRFLNRIYATISHGIIAIPAIELATTDTVAPFDPPIWLAPSSILNPTTNHTGLTLLPHVGILDGTIKA